ncbi:MAG: hypothetical protein H6852_19755 [Geminicoccaceae bacterium]|nr:hypothetical protein [Geminicoccaceae bacterium]MCB9969858.1 hypothetical protein [Geminicoccaceae bacterium]HRY26003.1 hypothetical protein [Geminicoccaceae bacterium]
MSAGPLYAWLIRAPDLSTPLLNFTDKSARLVFVRFEDALLARDSALALAEQGGYPVDLVMFRAGQPFLTIDPSEWRDDDPHVRLGQPPAPAEEPRS